jgi:hypothetical protein
MTVGREADYAAELVDKLIADIDKSVLLGSAMYCMTEVQRSSLRKRWAEIINTHLVTEHAAVHS